MNLLFIIGVLIFVAILLLVIKLTKKVVKTIALGGLVLLIISILLSVWVMKDLNEFRTRFVSEDKTIILADGDTALAGFRFSTGEPVVYTKEEIDLFSVDLAADNYESVRDDSYKLLLFSMESIENIETEEIQFNSEVIDKDTAVAVLRSESPARTYIEMKQGVILDDNLEVSYEDDQELKSMLFMTIFSNYIMQDQLYFFTQYKEGNVFIYPETALFKMIQFVPLALIDTSIKSLAKEVKQ